MERAEGGKLVGYRQEIAKIIEAAKIVNREAGSRVKELLLTAIRDRVDLLPVEWGVSIDDSYHYQDDSRGAVLLELSYKKRVGDDHPQPDIAVVLMDDGVYRVKHQLRGPCLPIFSTREEIGLEEYLKYADKASRAIESLPPKPIPSIETVQFDKVRLRTPKLTRAESIIFPILYRKYISRLEI